MNRAAKTDRVEKEADAKKGQGIAEFALLLALIAVAVTLALTSLGQESEQALERTGNALVNNKGDDGDEDEETVSAGTGCGM